MFYLLIVAVVVAIVFLVGYYYFRKDALYVIGIGAAVSANVYNVGTYGVMAGGIVWGVDAIIYTLFAFCIIVAIKDYGRKTAMAITYSSMAGIMLTAFFDFMAKWMAYGFAEDLAWGFLSFSISTIATFVAVSIAVLMFDKLRNKVQSWLNMGIGILVLSLINTFIYFGLMALIGGLGANFGITLLGSYIVKFVTLVFFVEVYYLCNYFIIKKHTKNDNK